MSAPLSNDENKTVSFKYGSPNTLPKKIIGKIINSNDTGVAVCPVKFKDNVKDYYETDNFIDGKELLKNGISINVPIKEKIDGKLTFSGKFYQKKYNVIGLYDPLETYDNYNTCYISASDIEDLYETAYKAGNGNDLPIAHIIVDDLKNVDNVMQTLTDKGFSAFYQGVINYDHINEVNQICNIIIIISCIGIFILTILYIKKINNDNLQNMGIQKAYGYSNGNIQNFSMCELLIISFISIFISFILIESCYLIIRIFFEDYINLKDEIITHSMLSYWFGFLIILVVPIITNSLLNLFYNKKNAINLIRKK